MSAYKIGPYTFTPAEIYDDAKPPEEPGVYILMIQGPNGGRPAARYVGKSGNLKQRLRLDHEHYQKLYEQVRNLNRIFVAWHLLHRDKANPCLKLASASKT